MEHSVIGVVGGSGFIGTCLVRRLLSRGHGDVRVIDKVCSDIFPELTRIADVRSVVDLDVSLEGIKSVVHLAAEHRDDIRPSSLYDEVNVGGAKNLVAVARERGIQKIIFTSSVAVYGFTPFETGEEGCIAPFNDYGRTKFEAEQIFREWQAEAPTDRCLVIIRPTVVFGEGNRGNVYNLMRQIASKRFVMVGDGTNQKSVAYVENIAAFIEHCMSFGPGVHLFNYVDKPDFAMSELVALVEETLGLPSRRWRRIPFWAALLIGRCFDFVSLITTRKFSISAIRVRKFCATSIYRTSVGVTCFCPPVSIMDALKRTALFEFSESNTTRRRH